MSGSSRSLVSVIMPAYNAGAYIDQAIQSILTQTYASIELIISDDGSSDDTLSKVTAFNDPRIIVLKHPQNLGYVENMNVLLRAAKGEYIVIQDADDYSASNRIEVLVNFLELNHDIDMVGSSYVKIEGSNEEKITLPADQEIVQRAFQALADSLPVLNGSVLFRKKIVDQGFLFRSIEWVNRGQDDDWLFRISEKFKVANVPDYLYYYRSNSSSMTLNPSLINYYSIFAGEYVRFLTSYRRQQGVDVLVQGRRQEIETFFKHKKNAMTQKEPAYLESYIAHKYLGIGQKARAVKWLLKAVLKDPGNSFFWKKIGVVLLNKQI